MIAAEVADIKKERVHRFRRHNTDVRGTVFIEFPKDEGGWRVTVYPGGGVMTAAQASAGCVTWLWRPWSRHITLKQSPCILCKSQFAQLQE
jgi:hypothetical protein